MNSSNAYGGKCLTCDPFHSTYNGITKIFVQPAIKNCTHLFVRVDKYQVPQQPPSEGQMLRYTAGNVEVKDINRPTESSFPLKASQPKRKPLLSILLILKFIVFRSFLSISIFLYLFNFKSYFLIIFLTFNLHIRVINFSFYNSNSWKCLLSII